MLKYLSEEKIVYTEMHLKKILQENFKERIVISVVSGKKNVLWLSDNVHKALEIWYKNHEAVVSADCDIIRDDIQKMTNEWSYYLDFDAIIFGEKSLFFQPYKYSLRN